MLRHESGSHRLCPVPLAHQRKPPALSSPSCNPDAANRSSSGRWVEAGTSHSSIWQSIASCEHDLTKLRVRDVAHGAHVSSRAIVMQQKTHRPVQFEITAQTRAALETWLNQAHLRNDNFLFPSRQRTSAHLSTRQYSRIVKSWVASIALDPASYGTHSMRRTKASLIYRRTKKIRAVQILLGHTKLESTVRYLGIEVDDSLEMAEQTEV